MGVTAVGVVGGIASSQAQKGAQKDQSKVQQLEDELNFQRQVWMAQQQRLWQLQDRQYKQNVIAGFRGKWGDAGITPPNQNADMNGLTAFDPNKKGTVGANTYGNAPTTLPATNAPLGQLAPPNQYPSP